MKKYIVSVAFVLLFKSFLFAASYEAIGGKSYNYSSTNSSASNYSMYESGIQYLAGAGYGGMGVRIVDWSNSASIGGYDTMYFSAKAEIAIIDIALRDSSNNDSVKVAYELSTTVSTNPVYKEYSYDLSNASVINLSAVSEILVSIKHNSLDTEVYLKDIKFVDNDGLLPTLYVSGKDYYTYPASASKIGGFGTYIFTGLNSSTDDPSYSGYGVIVNNITDDWNSSVDLSAYKRLAVTINSTDVNSVDFQFKMGDDSYSSVYSVDINGGNEFIEVDFDRFTSIDLADIKAIQMSIKAAAETTYEINVDNLVFDDVDNFIPVSSQLLIEKLSSMGFPVTNTKLTNDTDYSTQIKNVWDGYKKHFIEEYLPYADASVQGLIFDSQSYSPGVSDSGTNAHYIKSEGVGFGLLLSIYMNDQVTYDMILSKIWSYIQASSSGLMPWKIDSDGNVIDTTAASDADIDLAAALVFADTLVKAGVWTASIDYSARSQAMLDAIYSNLIEYNRFLKAGDTWGGKHITSLSYFSPAWFKVFAVYDKSDHDWYSVIDQGYKTLESQAGYLNGLVPDWCTAAGGSAKTYYSDREYYLRWDATRTYWRIALDSIWNNDSRANAFLDNTRTTFSTLSSMQSATFMQMNGSQDPDYNFTDALIIAMFTTGAMGSSSNTYKANWKSVFDGYQIHTDEGSESFFGVQSGTQDKYNYYLQSMNLLGSLLMTGAMPDIYGYFADNASLSASTTGVSTVWNKTAVQIPVKYTSTQGGGSISSTGLWFLSSGVSSYISAGSLKYSGPCNISGSGIKQASYERSIDGNDLNVTYNVIFDAASWGTRTFTLRADATPYRGSSISSDIDSYTFKPYSREYVSSVNINIDFGVLKRGLNLVPVSDPVVFAADVSSWNISLYSDNVPTRDDDAGLMGLDPTGNADFIPVDVFYNTTGAYPTPFDEGWLPINDISSGKTILRSGSSVLDLSNHYFFFKCNAIDAKGSDYAANVTLKVVSEYNAGRIDDFEDGQLMSEFGTYWSAVNRFEDTVASVEVINEGENSFMKLTYTLGAPQGNYLRPEAMALITFDKNDENLPKDLSKYKGISFDIKASDDIAFAISLESKLYTADYDEFHFELGKIDGGWIHYEILFKDFKQYGWGTVADINDVLTSLNSLKFKTLSEQQGESASVEIDNISFIKQ